MKLKIKLNQLTQHPILMLFRSNICFVCICLLIIPFISNASNTNNTYKLNFKVGEVLHYKTSQVQYFNNDTTSVESWVKFEVVDKEDSIFTVVGTNTRVVKYSKNEYLDSNHPNLAFEYNVPDINQPFPFQLTETGVVLPIVVPDSIIRRKIKAECEYELFKASLLIKNIRSRQEVMTYFFQQFFGNESIVEGESEKVQNSLNYKIKIYDLYIQNNLTEYSVDTEVLPLDSSAYFRSPINYTCHVQSQFDTETNSLFRRTLLCDFGKSQGRSPKSSLNEVQQYTPTVNDTLVTITGEVDEFCTPQDVHFFIYNNFILSEEFYWNEHIGPGKSFEYHIPLHQALAVVSDLNNFHKVATNVLLEPGDSIHFNVTPNCVEYSGNGALKNRLYQSMHDNHLELNASLTELEAKKSAESWILSETNKITLLKDQLSVWAYNQMRCDIYYSAQNELIRYYYLRNKTEVNEASFNMLFDSIAWKEHQSLTSMEMMKFVDSYLYRKLLIMKGYMLNSTIPETDKYHLAQIIFKDQTKYIALSQCVYQALKANDIEEGRNLFFEYEKTYKGTGFYNSLKKKIETRVDLGNGAILPDFEMTDIRGKKVSKDKLKGKYVQLLFINLRLDHNVQDLKDYQKLVEDIGNDKFELITVFVNEDDSLTEKYISENHPKGILVKNPGWKNQQLEKFNMQNSAPFFLVNPNGIIIFAGSGSPNRDFVNMIIEMINSDVYSKEETSISKSTLYWVLSVSVFSILFILAVVIAVTKGIKRREKLRREQVELKLSAVRSQLNPHFLFNSMSSIQYLVNHNENEKANLFLSKFAQLMRKVLFQTETERVPIKEELSTIETYLELEALRHRFQYEIKIDDSIDLHNTEIPVMLVQPFVENAVIHGIAHLAEKGRIEIQIEKISTNHLSISVVDNGLGYSKNAESNAASNGKGLQLTQKRIDLIMAKYGSEISFKVYNRNEIDDAMTGTQVEIIIETEV